MRCLDVLICLSPYFRQGHARIRVARIEGVQVLDFTPEWDYTAGGTKLLLTGSVLPGARTEAHTRPLYIKFDQTQVLLSPVTWGSLALPLV